MGCGGLGPCEGPSVGDSGSGSWRASEVGRFSQKKSEVGRDGASLGLSLSGTRGVGDGASMGNQEGKGIVVELGFRGTIMSQTYD